MLMDFAAADEILRGVDHWKTMLTVEHPSEIFFPTTTYYHSRIVTIWERIIGAFPDERPNDYQIFIFCGGSGVGENICMKFNSNINNPGKTTTGKLLHKLICAFFGGKLGLQADCVKCHHLFILPQTLPVKLKRPQLGTKGRPIRDKEDVTAGSEALSLGIALSFFFAGLDPADYSIVDQSLEYGLRSLGAVIAAIRKHEQLKDEDTLVLFTQLDEFQNASYLTLCMMRSLSDSIRTGFCWRKNTLIVPILTGTTAEDFRGVEENYSATDLHGIATLIEGLPPTSTLWLTELCAGYQTPLPSSASTTTSLTAQPTPAVVMNKLFIQLVEAGGQIPIMQKIIGLAMHDQDPHGQFNSLDGCRKIWENAVQRATYQYPQVLWIESFGSVENIKKILSWAVLETVVTRGTRLNGSSIADHEKQGLIFLVQALTEEEKLKNMKDAISQWTKNEPIMYFETWLQTLSLESIKEHRKIDDMLDPHYKYNVKLGSLLLFTVHKLFDLNLIPNELKPFCLIGEDAFESYVAAVHVAFCRLLTIDGKSRTISIREFFPGAIATGDTLNSMISIQPGISLRSASEWLSTTTLEKAELIAEGCPGGKEVVDIIKSNYVVVNKKRDPAGDIYTPQISYQVKSSQDITFGKEPTEKISLFKNSGHGRKDSVLNEIKKLRKTTKGLLAIISNKSLEEYNKLKKDPKPIPKGVVIICRENFRQYMRIFATPAVYFPPESNSQTNETISTPESDFCHH